MTSLHSTTDTSEMEVHKRARFALLARVGRQKREVSTLLAALDSSYSNVTELVALSVAQLQWAEEAEQHLPQEMKDQLVTLSSAQTQLIRQILYSLPDATICRELCLKMLNSDGLAMAMDVTPEGYVSPSGDQILRNVARALGPT